MLVKWVQSKEVHPLVAMDIPLKSCQQFLQKCGNPLQINDIPLETPYNLWTPLINHCPPFINHKHPLQIVHNLLKIIIIPSSTV